MASDDEGGTVVELTTDKHGHPVLHVLHYAGTTKDQVDVWRTLTMVVPEASPGETGDDGVYLMPVRRDGTPYVDATGQTPLFRAPPLQLGPHYDPSAPLSRNEIAERAGVSLSTVKRAEKAGELGKPTRLSPRRVVYSQDQARQWWDQHRNAGSAKR